MDLIFVVVIIAITSYFGVKVGARWALARKDMSEENT